MSDELNGDFKDLIVTVAGLTEAVNTLKLDFSRQGDAVEERLKHSIRADSVREIRLSKFEEILIRLNTLVESHEKIASSINVKHIGKIDEYFVWTGVQVAREKLIAAMKSRLMEHGIKILIVIMVAGVLTFFGFSDFARKILNG